MHRGVAGSQLIAIAGGQALQRVSRRLDHTGPVARTGLAKLAQLRIPGAVVAVQQPAPAGIEAVQQPNRLAERAGLMGDRGVDTDDEVKIGDEGGGIGEVVQIGGKIVQSHAPGRVGALSRWVAFLQRDEADPRCLA